MDSTEIAPPTTDLPSGEPVPMSSAPIPQAKPLPLMDLIDAAPSNIDAFLAHLHRCLQTPSGIDTILLFLCYTSRLGASVLQSATGPAIKRSAERLLKAADALPPSATLVFSSKAFPSRSVAVILQIAKRLRAFSVLLSDVRTFMRLWGLLNMYFWARGLVFKWRQSQERDGQPKTDMVETAIAWAQLTACVVFQSLENGAYLSSKGVLGWAPATQAKVARWSARFWGGFVGIELGRLVYDLHKRSQRSAKERIGNKTIAEVELEEREWMETWRKSVVRNAAWAPLTVHWSLEKGYLSEMAIGALASIPGFIQMRDLWRRTAE
ncbi:hypothetical protein DL765_005865 [Monosporascus sp. GIB2]|nr:hypothetical protein DL765_005865 [Monosporascus sp. GIB2]